MRPRPVTGAYSPTRTGKDAAGISAARQRRFAFLEEELFWKGEIGREVLSTTFGLTPNHITDDLAAYKAVCPNNLVYDESSRRYRPTRRFKARFTAADPGRFLADLRAIAEAQPGISSWHELLPDAGGFIGEHVLQTFTRAIHAEAGVRISYQSLSTEAPTRRTVFPHAIGHNGRRWFVRAYDDLRSDFRDFVLTRILSAAATAGELTSRADDRWNARIVLIVRPNPRLHPFQRDIIAREYGMVRENENWIWKVEARLAMVVYFLDLHRLRPEEQVHSPARAPLILENYDEIAGVDWARTSNADIE